MLGWREDGLGISWFEEMLVCEEERLTAAKVMKTRDRVETKLMKWQSASRFVPGLLYHGVR